MFKIRRVNIYNGLVLAVSYLFQIGESKTCYVLLDSGAGTSLITAQKANQLGLQIQPTIHRAVQVDGETDLLISGEVHLQFYRQELILDFSALVMEKLAGTDIIGGANFIVDNHIVPDMNRGTIKIADTTVIQSTSPVLVELDQQENMRQRVVGVTRHTTLHPGDHTILPVPPGFPTNGSILVEPNLLQVKPFFAPHMTEVISGTFSVPNDSDELFTAKKNLSQSVICPLHPHQPRSPWTIQQHTRSNK